MMINRITKPLLVKGFIIIWYTLINNDSDTKSATTLIKVLLPDSESSERSKIAWNKIYFLPRPSWGHT